MQLQTRIIRALSFLALLALAIPLPAADDTALKVCLLSGCPTYHSEKSLPLFQEWLEKNYTVKCTQIVREGHTFPGLDKLADCDSRLFSSSG